MPLPPVMMLLCGCCQCPAKFAVPDVRQIFNIGAERIGGKRGANLVAPLLEPLCNLVARTLDIIDVPAAAAEHRIVADAAIEVCRRLPFH